MSTKVVLPQPEDWQHRPGAPGYFVTKDGRFQMLMTKRGTFAICETVPTQKGFEVVRGPSANPEALGIQARLLEEAEELTVQSFIEQLAAGQEVTIRLAGAWGGKR